MEDEQLEIPDDAFEGDLFLEPQIKYSSAGAAIYVFRSPAGTEFVGNKAMIDMSLPEHFPSLY